MHKKTKALLQSAVSLLLCISMLIGSTFAWFTDSVTSSGNIITTGKLDLEMYWTDKLDGSNTTWKNVENAADNTIFNHDNWEPGYTQVRYIKLVNAGNLALKYQLAIEPVGAVGDLADAIRVYSADNGTVVDEYADLASLSSHGILRDVLNHGVGATVPEGNLQPNGEVIVTLAMSMDTAAGNEYQSKDAGAFTVKALATQYASESDSFGADYDSGAQYDYGSSSSGGGISTTTASVSVVPTDDDKVPTGGAAINGTGASAAVPEGVQLNAGTTKLTLSIAPMANSAADVDVDENEVLIPVDVHIEGVAEDNTVPIIISIKEALPVGLNMGNFRLVHVEDGVTNTMTSVASLEEVAAHNDFYYDPATGDVTIAMATFSEVALVADTVNAWNGDTAEDFAGGEGTEDNPYLIANADQLVYFGDLISNDNENYGDKYYKLIADINLGGEENANAGIIFYPIGYHKVGEAVAALADDDAPEFLYFDEDPDYARGSSVNAIANDANTWYTYGGSFKGTFDGAGHKISNIYQNTWQLKGNYSGNYWNAAMGLFGYVNGGTVKNLTVDNFSSDGEFTPTGVIAAYAANSTFENIAITNCNPRVYNTGNGGIVGIGGNSDDPDTYNLTFTNITIDNTNKISALWGSWDVACGGLVGMFRGAGHVDMTNCHVAAQIDVFNDVCGNYQYYWYRYAGMMVGTNKNMTTDANGYTVPETDKFHAENCTVHFGEWNDYYYCELVANSLASYTHDHQFSRLTEVDSIDVENMTVAVGGETTAIPTSGRCNYVVVNGEAATENATCYHFVNGEVWTHDKAGTETVNGETVLKEDKQHYYLPFNQLFTGYGWGVKHIPVYNGEDYAFDGITILDREVADSVVKFESKVAELNNNKEYKLGDIFSFVNNGVDLEPNALTVTVTNLDDNNPVSATFERNANNWADGTLAFTGAGKVQITIQDYYFCTPTTITVGVTDREPEVKFDVVMNNGNFLHRVGNSGTVPLDKLFKAKDGVTVGTVDVTVEAVNGTETSGIYSNNAIQFSGTGVVKVTVTDNDYCIPTELYLEVVEATNLTSATGTTTGGNFVLLCDVNTNTYVNYWNCTLYGNGFTYSLEGAPTAYNSKQGHGILITKNATLDNLVIVGDVYNSYGAYTTQDYYNAAVDVMGDTIIQNCHISGCAAPVSTRANATITNTTLYGGTVANLIIKSGTATLKDVTTANYDDGRSLVGMGIVIHSDATESAKLVLNGTLTQYNFISESKVPTDTYAKNLYTTMFDDSCSKYHFGTSPNRYVNTGVISLTALFDAEDITDNANTGYVGTGVSVSGVNGYVYTQPNTSGSVNNGYDKENDPHVATTQGAVAPDYSFDYTNKNYVAKTDGSNDYCYEENGKVNISMDEGDTFNWDTSILTIGKGITNYTVSMNGTDYTGKSIAFNTTGDYEVVYTYTDDNNYKLDEDGNITTYSETYTKTVSITVAVIEAATKHAEFTFGSSNTASTTVTVGNNTYVMPNVSATSSTIGSTTVSGQTIYYPIVEIVMSDGKTSHTSGWYAYFPVFSGAVTITDYKDNGLGDAETFGSSTQSMPSGLSIVGDPAQLFKYQSSSTAGTSPVVKNNILVYSSPSISAKRSEYNTVIQYSYQDNAGATYYYYIGYHAPAQSYTSCVTPDTLVTLANGTQKRIDQVTYNDTLLAWDFNKGAYTAIGASIVENHGYAKNEVIKLAFEDGTVVKVVNVHGFFDADTNQWVDINAANATNFVGHRFTQVNGKTYKTVKLVSADVTTEYVEAWSILTCDHYNCIMEGMFSITPPATKQLAFFEIGANMKYDATAKLADIREYGLYKYSEFDHLLTYAQFDAFNIPEIKVAVGKGLITYDEVVTLINAYA